MIKPSRVQYLQIKSQYADAILFYQVGDFYETYDEDAYVAARVLQIVLTKKTYGEERVPMAGVPLHALENYVGKLIQHGYKVAICEQVGEVGKGLVERAVTRILTAGTLSEPNLLPARQNNFLVAIASGRTQTALAAVDVSTGEFSVTWFAPDELPAALEGELQRLAPTECLLVEGSRAYKFPSETMTLTTCPPYFFELEAARTRLCRLFGVQSLDAYGCASVPQERLTTRIPSRGRLATTHCRAAITVVTSVAPSHPATFTETRLVSGALPWKASCDGHSTSTIACRGGVSPWLTGASGASLPRATTAPPYSRTASSERREYSR